MPYFRASASRGRRPAGFTLIELLVVIAIIAILAAILFPVFAQARASARGTRCISNQRNIGMGMQQYLQDYDGVLPDPAWQDLQFTPSPPAPAAPGPSSLKPYARLGWFMANLDPYIRNRDVWVCPSIPPYANESAWSDGLYAPYRLPGQDLPNLGRTNYLSAKFAEPDPTKARCARGKMPEMVGTGEVSSEHLLYCGFYSRAWDPAPWRRGGSTPSGDWQAHRDRRIELFFDGHAKAIRP